MHEWSEQQLAVFSWVETSTGSAVVEAVAGAGKTTTLVEAVRRMPGTAYVAAYNTKMGAELKKRISGIPGKMAGTFHSVGFGALRRASSDERLEVDEKKVRKLADRMLVGTPQVEWSGAACTLVSLAKQRGFYAPDCVASPRRADWMETIVRYDVMERLPEDVNPNRLMDVADKLLEQSNADYRTIDFDDMCYLPLYRGLSLFKNDWVVVDESQDVNPVRRALARRMLRRGGRLLAVGDPCQAIFGFTGADHDSMELIKRDFDAETLNLSVSYRCPRLVVEQARRYVGHITSHPLSPEGEVSEMSYEEMLSFAGPGDAVLSRYNAPIVELCFKLIRAGKPAKIEGRSVGEGLSALAGRWKVRTLEALRSRLDKYLEKELDKAREKGDEARAERARDKVATMFCLMDRAGEQGVTTVAGLQATITSMFDDVGADERLVVLSSVHRSKGLEWNRVFLLGRGQVMPPPRASQDWQRRQELNICYVAVTRAKRTLVDVKLPESPEQ